MQPLKPIRECDREQRLERALLLIDALVSLQCPPPEEKLLNTIYEIAHAAHGRCCETAEGWLKTIDELEVEFKKNNVMDMTESLARPARY